MHDVAAFLRLLALCTHPDAMHLRTPRELGRAAAVLHGARTYGA